MKPFEGSLGGCVSDFAVEFVSLVIVSLVIVPFGSLTDISLTDVSLTDSSLSWIDGSGVDVVEVLTVPADLMPAVNISRSGFTDCWRATSVDSAMRPLISTMRWRNCLR
jgi:hypothetical protein